MVEVHAGSLSASRTSGTMPSWPGLLWTQIRYQLRLSLRSSRAMTSAILLPVLILIALHTSGGTGETNRVLVAGALVYGVLSVGYLTHATVLVTAREKGVLKRFRGSPLPPWTYLAGRIVATTVMAVIASCVALEIAEEVVDVDLPMRRIPALILVLFAGAIVWAALGTLASGLIPTPDAAWSTLVSTFLPLMFISGVFIPTSQEPDWLARIADWLPAEPFGDLVERAMAGTLATSSAGRDWLVLAGWLVLAAVGARFFFQWLPVPPKHRKATRSGAGKK